MRRAKAATGSGRAVAVLAALALAACGKRGDPLPPVRRTAPPLTDLRLAQHGDRLVVAYTVPRVAAEGERLPVMDVEIVRAEKPGPLEKIGRRNRKKVAPGELIREEEALPAVGTRVRVAARVILNGRPATLSAEVVLLVRPPVDPPTATTARSSPLGVVVEWTGVLPPKPAPSPSPSPSPGSPRPPSPAPTATPTPPGTVAQPEPPSGSTPASPAPLAAAKGESGKPPETKPTPPPPPTSGFWVYRRSPDGSSARPLSPNPVETLAFEDTTARPGERWCYAVRTVVSTDPAVESADSNEACLDVKDMAPPATPTGLTAIVRDNVVELSWSPSPEPDIAAYRIYRSPAGAPLSCTTNDRLADVPAGETSYADRLLRPGMAYLYGVAARDRGGNESPCSAHAEGGIQ